MLRVILDTMKRWSKDQGIQTNACRVLGRLIKVRDHIVILISLVFNKLAKKKKKVCSWKHLLQDGVPERVQEALNSFPNNQGPFINNERFILSQALIIAYYYYHDWFMYFLNLKFSGSPRHY